VRRLAAELSAQRHPICRTVVCELLHELNFSLQANCKTGEGDSHPDRDAQFCYINDLVNTGTIPVTRNAKIWLFKPARLIVWKRNLPMGLPFGASPAL
jgi:hypothetical protein